ncbi:MAG: GNAT family N-acetyltransferase [Methanomicrobiales archaeon]|nr:GNAT family N-acetyltransferase [Methanomicrobiales archaeon]
MAPPSIEYSVTDFSGIERIRSLWNELNRHHNTRARAFRDVYSRMTFDDRKAHFATIAGAGRFRIDLASDPAGGICVGYCVSSVNPAGDAEIESVFVAPAFRSRGVGTALMERVLAWLSAQNPGRIQVWVADGNEEAFAFYRKFRFYPRMTVLEQKIP